MDEPNQLYKQWLSLYCLKFFMLNVAFGITKNEIQQIICTIFSGTYFTLHSILLYSVTKRWQQQHTHIQ